MFQSKIFSEDEGPIADVPEVRNGRTAEFTAVNSDGDCPRDLLRSIVVYSCEKRNMFGGGVGYNGDGGRKAVGKAIKRWAEIMEMRGGRKMCNCPGRGV
jgi:hypothetical protein